METPGTLAVIVTFHPSRSGVPRIIAHVAEARIVNGETTTHTLKVWDGLELNCYVYKKSDQWACREGSPYFAANAFYAIELDQAAHMVSTLKKVERAMKKLYESEGSATTLGAGINRFARAIGAKAIIIDFESVCTSTGLQDSSGYRYRWYPQLGDAVRHIDHHLESFRERLEVFA